MGGYKLKVGKVRLDFRKKVFTAKVVRHWNALPRKAVDVPSVKCSRSGWMGQPGLVGGVPAPGRGWGWIISRAISNPSMVL